MHVVAPEAVPLSKVFGEQLGSHIKSLHEQHGVTFSLQKSVTAIGATDVTLDEGSKLPRGHRRHRHRRAAEPRSREANGAHGGQRRRRQRIPRVERARHLRGGRHRVASRIDGGAHARRALRGGRAARAVRRREHAGRAATRTTTSRSSGPRSIGKEIRYVGHASTIADAVVGGDIERAMRSSRIGRSGKPVAFASLGRDFACLQAERALEDERRASDERAHCAAERALAAATATESPQPERAARDAGEHAAQHVRGPMCAQVHARDGCEQSRRARRAPIAASRSATERIDHVSRARRVRRSRRRAWRRPMDRNSRRRR